MPWRANRRPDRGLSSAVASCDGLYFNESGLLAGGATTLGLRNPSPPSCSPLYRTNATRSLNKVRLRLAFSSTPPVSARVSLTLSGHSIASVVDNGDHRDC